MRLLLLLFIPSLLAAANTEPPVRERADFAVISLNRLALGAAPEPAWGLLPKKKEQLPLSVQLYLKPSGQLDHLSGAVQKAAAAVRRAVAPGSKQADKLRDASLVAQGVRGYLDANLALDDAIGWQGRPSIDPRLAWPKASLILKEGRADQDGRALAAVALLRALKVPARVAWARGHYTVQYWRALEPVKAAKPSKPKKGAKAPPKPPLGAWLQLEEGLHESEVDAYSLDNGMLAPLRWQPQQELSARLLAYERTVFSADASVTAQAAFDASVVAGRLSASAQSLSLAAQSVLQGLTQGAATLWVLTVAQWQLEAEGVMGALDHLDLITPYRPHLASWGREQRLSVRELELQAQGVWTDRPTHLKQDGRVKDEWMSPPPALGVLHWASVSKRRLRVVLQAARQGQQVQGVVLRADNLSPWPADLSITSACGPQTLKTDALGLFSLPWCPSGMLLSLPEGMGDAQRLRENP